MLEDNLIFEWMIHIMEFGVVIGIIAVTWYIKTAKKKSKTANIDHES